MAHSLPSPSWRRRRRGAAAGDSCRRGLPCSAPSTRSGRFTNCCASTRYELLCQHEEELELDLVRLARREEPVRRFTALPGILWIRAVTFYAYLDTPHRFQSKEKLWKYCGIGLEKRHSGSGSMQVRVTKGGNRHLKSVLMGAAISASFQGENPFGDKYRYWTQQERQHPLTACRNVARTFANTLWGMWKNGSEYDPKLIRGVGLIG